MKIIFWQFKSKFCRKDKANALHYTHMPNIYPNAVNLNVVIETEVKWPLKQTGIRQSKAHALKHSCYCQTSTFIRVCRGLKIHTQGFMQTFN